MNKLINDIIKQTMDNAVHCPFCKGINPSSLSETIIHKHSEGDIVVRYTKCNYCQDLIVEILEPSNEEIERIEGKTCEGCNKKIEDTSMNYVSNNECGKLVGTYVCHNCNHRISYVKLIPVRKFSYKEMESQIAEYFKSKLQPLKEESFQCRVCNSSIPKDDMIATKEQMVTTNQEYIRYNCPKCHAWLHTDWKLDDKKDFVDSLNSSKVENDNLLQDKCEIKSEPIRICNSSKFNTNLKQLEEDLKNKHKVEMYNEREDINHTAKMLETKYPVLKESALKMGNVIKKKKGFVIVIEGTDGSGKNTQANLIQKALDEKGVKNSLYSFPNYETIQGSLVKRYLNGEFENQGNINDDKDAIYRTAMLYSNDRMVSCMEKDEEGKSIIDRYNEGEVIIFDRYTQSNFIHQGSKFNNKEDLCTFMDTMENIEYDIMGLPIPDMIFYLKVPVELSIQNIKKRGNEVDIHENEEHLKAVNKHVDYIIDYHGWDKIDCSDGLMNAGTNEVSYHMRPIKDIHRQLMDGYIQPRLRAEGYLDHINYCPKCTENDILNIELKPIEIANKVEGKSYDILRCPICNSCFDKSNL